MATFDSDQEGLAEPTNDDDVADLDVELSPVDGPSAARSGENKLQQLLAKSRSVSSNTGGDAYNADDRTDVASPEAVNAALQPGFANRAPAHPAGAPGPPAAAAPPPQVFRDPSVSASLPNPSGMMPMYAPAAPVPLSPSGEFGIVPDIGLSRDDVPEYEPPTERRRRSIAVAVTFVVGLIAFVVISKLIVDQWVAPGRAVVWMTAGTTLPTLLAGLLLAWPNRSGRASLRDVLVALVPALALSGGAIFVATTWTQAPIRKAAVAFAQDSPSAMGAILEDPSAEVAVEGCKRFAPQHEKSDYRALLFAALTVRPKIATKCMAELPEDSQLAIATSLSDRWSRELAVKDDQTNDERLCDTAGGLASLPLDRAAVGARLLQCTISSPSLKAQACCGTALGAMVVGEKQWANHLRESMEYVKDDRTASGVFALAFHQKNLTTSQKKFADDLKFTSPPVQLAALEFACGSLENGRTGVIRHMRAALEGECAIDPGGVPSTLSTWREICELTLAELEADRTRPTTATMCEMTKDMAMITTVGTAMRIVRLAHGKDLKGTFARQIDLGYIKVLDEINRNGNEGDIPDFVSKDDARSALMNPGTKEQLNSNFEFAGPGDDEFQAFRKAYKALEPWKANAQQKETRKRMGK